MCIDDYFSYHQAIHDTNPRSRSKHAAFPRCSPGRLVQPIERRLGLEDMAAIPTPSQLAPLDDEELAQLAVSWRAQAGRGDREAFGIAHALEVEQRRRTRESQLQQLPPEQPPLPRPWWKFWQSGDDRNPTSAS